jgi:uncharacterized membrane protein
MQRYATKHFWRMTESEQGEFVRYEDVEQENKINARLYNNLWNDWINTSQEVIQARDLIEHLLSRVVVMFCIIMAMMGMVVGNLIVWSLGL